MDETTERATASQAVRIQLVPNDRPWMWLEAGWRDLMATPHIGFFYGGAVVAAGWLLVMALIAIDALWAVLPAVAGFFLVAPLVGAGLYDTSRRRERGEEVSLGTAFGAFRRNAPQLALMGAVLLVINLFWVRMAGLIFMVFFGLNFSPSLENLPLALLRSEQLLPFLIIGTGVGFVLASIAFAVSAVSIPMLVDRDVSAVEAIVASLKAVAANPKPLALWAALIVVFVGLGLAPFFLGLVVALPLIAHATWHAYKDLVA